MARFRHHVATRSSAPTAPEPQIVIEHREELIYMICEAAELEHSLMCEYLFAAFSLKRGGADGLGPRESALVQRWRSVIVKVASDEMLHLAITANLLSALGASPHLSRPNLPQPAHHYPPGVTIALLPFGERALRHFLFLERPEGMGLEDAEGLAVVGEAAPVMGSEDRVPRPQDFATVGHLYRSIEAGFVRLVEKMGEERLFVGPAAAQVTDEGFRWPALIAVTDLDSARTAIETIVAQGEGPTGDWRHAHFGQFKTVLDEYLAARAADPGFEPARPVLPVGLRAGPDETERRITDPVTASVSDLFNIAYEALLLVLYRLLARIDETDEESLILADVAVGIMTEVMAPVASALGDLPIGPEEPGATAGAPFELFYEPDYLLPHHRAAWLLYGERLQVAARLARRLSESVPSLGEVADTLERLAQRLGTGGPAAAPTQLGR